MDKNAKLRFYIDNIETNAPLDWQNIEVLATFQNDTTQANISGDSWTFVNAEAQAILDHINNGLIGGLGIFEGIPFKVEAFNDSNTASVFDGMLDLTKDFVDDFSDNLRVNVKTRKKEGLVTLNEQLEGLTFGYLESLGVFNDSDYTKANYVVQRKINLFEELVAAFMIYQMSKELIQLVRDTGEIIANVVAHTLGGAPVPTAPASGIGYSIAVAILQVAYSVLLSIAIIKLTKQLIDTFAPPLRTHKTLNLRTALTKVSAHLGLVFNSDIPELDTYYYLPSNPQLNDAKLLDFINNNKGTKKGIPNVVDYGYDCKEFFQLCQNLFYAKIQVKDGQLYFYNEMSNFWLKNSTYNLPPVRPRTKRYNTADAIANLFINFDYDLNDEWTVDVFEGTNYEIVTDSQYKYDASSTTITKKDRVDFNVCLPTRKDKISFIEKAIDTVRNTLATFTNAFGSNATISTPALKMSALKQSNNWHSKPKILPLNKTGGLNINHRDELSAKYLYNNYHVAKSFVANNNYGQKVVYVGVRVPFGMEDYLKLIDNSYFVDDSGATGKVTQIKWRLGADYAIIDYWIREPYTKNLKETFIEAS